MSIASLRLLRLSLKIYLFAVLLPIMGMRTSDLSICVRSSGVYKLMFYLTIVHNIYVTVTLGWHDSTCSEFIIVLM